MQDNQTDRGIPTWVIGLACALIFAAGLLVATRARAQEAPSMPNLSGLYVGGSVGHTQGEISAGGPIGLSSSGIAPGAHVGIQLQAGQLVGVLEASYRMYYGDFDTIGIDKEIAVTAMGGFKLTPSTTIFAHISKAKLYTTFADVDGWKFGPAIQVSVPNSNVDLELRASYGMWDVGSFAPGLDANTYEVMGVVKYRFGGMFK